MDYWLLRPLVHRHRCATEQELDALAEIGRPFDEAQAKFRLAKWNRRLKNRIPMRRELRYLDVGCGHGDLTIAFALAGCGQICGIDVIPRCITRAKAYAKKLKLEDRVQFVCADFHQWEPPKKFNVVLSHEALEHISEPKAFLRRLGEMVTDDGIAVLAFGPLFHSPFGDHMNSFFRLRIPWKGVLFSEKAILRLRTENYRPSDSVSCYQDIKGGLNLMRYSEFLCYVQESGWHIDTLFVNPQLKSFWPLYWLSCLLTHVPIIKDYFAASIYAILRR